MPHRAPPSTYPLADGAENLFLKILGTVAIVVGCMLFFDSSPDAAAAFVIVGLLTLILATLRDVLHRIDGRR
jgi:hypothetical protein